MGRAACILVGKPQCADKVSERSMSNLCPEANVNQIRYIHSIRLHEIDPYFRPVLRRCPRLDRLHLFWPAMGDACSNLKVLKPPKVVASPFRMHVQPFRTEDPAKSGVRKIFVAFLVDPTYTIPSTTAVALHCVK